MSVASPWSAENDAAGILAYSEATFASTAGAAGKPVPGDGSQTDRRSRSGLGIAALLLSLAVGSSARAGGIELLDSGPVGIGRGGAFVAKGDDPTTIRYNPAGFAKLRSHHVTIAGQLSHVGTVFSRSANGSETHAPVANQEPFQVVPSQLMLTTDLGLFERLTLATGIHVPPAVLLEFPHEIDTEAGTAAAPQRYQSARGDGMSVILYPSFAAAFRVTDWLDVGGSFEWLIFAVSAASVATASAACDRPEDPACDITLKLKAADYTAVTGSTGVLTRPLPGLELGVAVRFPASCNAKGRAEMTLGSQVAKLNSALAMPVVSSQTPEVTLRHSIPWMVRGGARYAFALSRNLHGDVELDLVWENWSAARRDVLIVEAEAMGEPMEPQILDWRFQDTWSVRLGGELQFEPLAGIQMAARAGFFFETATTNVSDTALSVISAPRFAPTVGLGLRWDLMTLNVAYSHVFFPRRIVRGSVVKSRDMGGGSGNIVGNGTYDSSADFFALQLTLSFGTPSEAPDNNAGPKSFLAAAETEVGEEMPAMPTAPRNETPASDRLAIVAPQVVGEPRDPEQHIEQKKKRRPRRSASKQRRGKKRRRRRMP